MIAINKRCPTLPDDVEPGLRPGDLNAMFERIVATAPGSNADNIEIPAGMTNYSFTVHSCSAHREQTIIDTKLDLDQPPW